MKQIKRFIKNEISIGLLVLLWLSQIIPDYPFWAISCLLIGLDIIYQKGFVRIVKMPGEVFFWILFCIGLFNGIALNNQLGIWFIVRDAIRMLYIPTYWALSCIICRHEKYNIRVYYKTFYLFAGTYSLYKLIIKLSTLSLNLNSQNLFRTFSTSGMIDEYIIAIAMFISYFKPDCIHGSYISKKVDRLLTAIITTAFVLCFSRTSIMIFGMLTLFLGIKNAKSMLRIVTFGLFAIILVIMFMPGMVSTFLNKIEYTGTEVLSSRKYWDNTSIVQGWRGYEVYCAKELFDTFSFIEKIFGTGFGTSVDVHGYAYLVTSEDRLPYLHNGYFTSLLKLGVFGIVLTICMFVALWLCFLRPKAKSHYSIEMSRILVISLSVTMLFIHGIFWGQASLIIFLPIAWSFILNKTQRSYIY